MEPIKELADFANELGCLVQHDVPMSMLTTFRVGGPADFVITPNSIANVQEICRFANANSIKPIIIGNGSNLLVSDSGINGIVLKMTGPMNKISVDSNVITAQSGATLSKLCCVALENSLSGLEFAYGIPGSVGGAVYMNAGAYGGEISQVISECTHITPDGEIETVPVSKLELGYRESFYTRNPGYIILESKFNLIPDTKENIQSKMDINITARKEKQPLEFPSAGSIFKRPVGYFAGKLIEDCNLKGVRIGDAQVSEKHAGFIINKGNATQKEISELIKLIQDTVFAKYGVLLESEVKFI